MKSLLRLLADHLKHSALRVAAVCMLVSVVVAAGFATLGGPVVGVAAILLALVLIELSWRLVFLGAYGPKYRFSFIPYLFQDHPDYGNGLRPNTDVKKVPFLLFDKYIFRQLPPPLGSPDENIAARYDIRINSRGYRAAEFDAEKKRRLRIFCSGGSTTACYGDDAETWPARLEQEFAGLDKDVEVINGGVWGWTSAQELARLRREIEGINPDVVLLHQGWNEEFMHSLLHLGRTWHPNVMPTLAERELGVAPGALLARIPLVSVYLVGLDWKRARFKKEMAFNNRDRWKSLMGRRYIEAWVDNLHGFCRLATDRGFLLYTIDPPCLVGMDDKYPDRSAYIQRSRLTKLYADYQAVSKARIRNVLQTSAPALPCVDVAGMFASIAGEERARLFRDEIHLTPAGDALFAAYLAGSLADDADFVSRYENTNLTRTNVDFASLEPGDWKVRASAIEPYVGRFVSGVMAELKDGKPGDPADVSEDMYTTY